MKPRGNAKTGRGTVVDLRIHSECVCEYEHLGRLIGTVVIGTAKVIAYEAGCTVTESARENKGSKWDDSRRIQYAFPCCYCIISLQYYQKTVVKELHS